jgi:hypothetical protein
MLGFPSPTMAKPPEYPTLAVVDARPAVHVQGHRRDKPAQAGQGTAAKDEAGTAAAIAGNPVGQGTAAKDEAGTAVAIGGVSAPGEGVTAKDEAGTAAAISGR